MLDTIRDSTDEELDNQKRMVVRNIEADSSLLLQTHFDIGHFSINPIPKTKALAFKDTYSDEMYPMQDRDDPFPEMEPVRMLRTAFAFNGKYYELRIINSMIEEDDLAKELFYSLIILYFLLVSSIVWVNSIVLKKVWTPFYRLLSLLNQYKLGESKETPIIQTEIQEFNDLNTTLNSLLVSSNQIYLQQKEFIENASHELKTPIAVVIGKLELLIEQNQLSDNMAQDISELLSIIERMKALNSSLLLLSKIKNKQHFENETICLNEIVAHHIENFKEFLEAKQLHIQLNIEHKLNVNMDKVLANCIVQNLLKNSFFHTKNGGEVSIELSENSFIVRNDANGKKLDETRIFERFSKSESQSSGTGLGLAIVKEICGLYQFRIDYSFERKQHTFSVQLIN
jgi:signal transduction histidine kinase